MLVPRSNRIGAFPLPNSMSRSQITCAHRRRRRRGAVTSDERKEPISTLALITIGRESTQGTSTNLHVQVQHLPSIVAVAHVASSAAHHARGRQLLAANDSFASFNTYDNMYHTFLSYVLDNAAQFLSAARACTSAHDSTSSSSSTSRNLPQMRCRRSRQTGSIGGSTRWTSFMVAELKRIPLMWPSSTDVVRSTSLLHVPVYQYMAGGGDRAGTRRGSWQIGTRLKGAAACNPCFGVCMFSFYDGGSIDLSSTWSTGQR